jgi:hypothetical protein
VSREEEDVYVRYALSLHQQIGRLTNALVYKRLDIAEYERQLAEAREKLADVEQRLTDADCLRDAECLSLCKFELAGTPSNITKFIEGVDALGDD